MKFRFCGGEILVCAGDAWTPANAKTVEGREFCLSEWATEQTGMAELVPPIDSDIFSKNVESLKRDVFQNLMFVCVN